jgi:hypothetical protein
MRVKAIKNIVYVVGLRPRSYTTAGLGKFTSFVPSPAPLFKLILKIALVVSLVWAFFPSQRVDAMPGYMSYRIDLFNEAYSQSLWPESLRAKVLRLAFCESTIRHYQNGDHGRAQGYLQVRVDIHKKIAAAFELNTPVGGLNGGYLVFLESGRSFDPWSCKV